MMDMVVNEFLERHPVFTLEEFKAFLDENASVNEWTQKNLLAYYKRKGRILGVKRGLYAVVPLGMEPDRFLPDPFLIAAKMAEDSVLSHHTALEFYGSAYSVQNRFIYLSRVQRKKLPWRGYDFKSVLFPSALLQKKKESFGIRTEDRRGLQVKVTGLERTMVDVFDRPDLGGGWEEIWRSIDLVDYLNLEEVVKYTLLLDNSTTVAKVGFYLEQNRERLMVDNSYLKRLRKKRPPTPRNMERTGNQPGKFVSSWNLVVPRPVYEKAWEEVT
jgi:predicted transcriptional regulator of viral defense system